MLIISREVNQSIIIGDDLELKITKLRGTSANLLVTRYLIGRRMSEQVFSGWVERDHSIDLGNEITCALVDVRGNPSTARLGIQAPKEISVHRKEVYEAIRRTLER